MSENTASDRLALKTPEASFLHVLEHEFNLAYREARDVVSTAREVLGLDRPTGQVPRYAAARIANEGVLLGDLV